jgi:hypothetical protein
MDSGALNALKSLRLYLGLPHLTSPPSRCSIPSVSRALLRSNNHSFLLFLRLTACYLLWKSLQEPPVHMSRHLVEFARDLVPFFPSIDKMGKLTDTPLCLQEQLSASSLQLGQARQDTAAVRPDTDG